MIKNVVFDIGNVLVKFDWENYYKSFGMSDEAYEKVVNATVKHPVWNEIDRGVMTEEEVLEAFIKNDPSVEKELRMVYENFDGLLKLFEYTKGWILDLHKRGYKVYCLSNMSHKAVRECWNALNFVGMLDGFVLSCDVQVTKPEPEIYNILFKQYDLNPDECVFFDDLPSNIEGANKLGMHGIVFKNVAQAEADLSKLENVENYGKENTEFKSKYTKKQRAGAIVCLGLIALLYIATIVFTIMGTEFAKTMLRISLGCTLVLPILTWVYIWIIGSLNKKDTIASFHFFEKLK